MTQLIRYESARKALAEAVMFDEVMNIMNVAEQAALYAKQANDTDLIEKATEIRVRAQRKAGEMLAKAKTDGIRVSESDHGRGIQASVEASDTRATLAQIGITRDQSSRYQSLASMSDEHFETAVATAKDTAGEVTTAFMLREAKKAKPQGSPKKGKKADAMRAELKAASERGTSMLCTYARLTISALNATESLTEEERQVVNDLRTAVARLVTH